MAEASTRVKVLILFGKPVDEDLFGRHFEAVHRKMLEGFEGLQRRTINYVAGSVTGDSSFHMLVELQFATELEMQRALNSAAGQAMARDFSNFASGGVTILLCRSEEVMCD